MTNGFLKQQKMVNFCVVCVRYGNNICDCLQKTGHFPLASFIFKVIRKSKILTFLISVLSLGLSLSHLQHLWYFLFILTFVVCHIIYELRNEQNYTSSLVFMRRNHQLKCNTHKLQNCCYHFAVFVRFFFLLLLLGFQQVGALFSSDVFIFYQCDEIEKLLVNIL